MQVGTQNLQGWCVSNRQSATCEAISSPWDKQEILRSVGIKIKEMSSSQISLGALLLTAPWLPCPHSLQFAVLTLWPKGTKDRACANSSLEHIGLLALVLLALQGFLGRTSSVLLLPRNRCLQLRMISLRCLG